MKKYFNINKRAWDNRASVHFASDFYNVNDFLRGNTSLKEIELNELPNIKGKRILHLQCHFGLDTLSLARMGGICTGVDISPESIKIAKELSVKEDLDVDFICSNVYDYVNDSKFDIIFSSYGAINWLPNLCSWGGVINNNLKSGGIFILVEFHPLLDILDGYSYFRNEPYVASGGTYTDGGEKLKNEMVNWPHKLSDVLNAMILNDMKIIKFDEYPYSPFDCFQDLQELEPGRFYRSHCEHNIPMVFSLIAQKI